MTFVAIVGAHLARASVGANKRVILTSTTSRGYIASEHTASLAGKMPFRLGSVLGMADVLLPAL
jgi:hypothetical protein